MSNAGLTPLMQQYQDVKRRHPDSVVLFRLGDFYEMFFDDAELAARVLGITLTSRNNGGAAAVPLAGVPVKAASEYIRRLVQAGHRVTICEQVEDPQTAKGLVRREVTETISPGVVLAEGLLEGAKSNNVCALCPSSESVGIAAIDVSTGSFHLIRSPWQDCEAAIGRLDPREVLVPRERGGVNPLLEALLQLLGDGRLLVERPSDEFAGELGQHVLSRHFQVASIDALGLSVDDAVVLAAAGALMRYVQELQPLGLRHLMRPVVDRLQDSLPLDEMTRRNLELVMPLRGGEDMSGTLLHSLDYTLTPMGARALREWLLAPLTNRTRIIDRLDAVEEMVRDSVTRTRLRSALAGVRDLERLLGRVITKRASPRDARAIGESLAAIEAVEEAFRRLPPSGCLRHVGDAWDRCPDLSELINAQMVDRPPAVIGDEPTFRPGVDTELDRLRGMRDGGREAIALLQTAERERTGISSLKVGYNKVFGYFIEVSNSHQHRVPPDYVRRQTLSGAERFITPYLKTYEEQVFSAATGLETRERELFEALCGQIAKQAFRVQRLARSIAELDGLACLAEVASREAYCRPDVNDEDVIAILDGRHPVVERMMPREKFIPNDVQLSGEERLILLTGPNMAGKSTILRQTGLIVLMAQMGSFVPARRATIGLVDRIFTRVGASDNLVRGQSTFMVEMAETSAILAGASSRSLVLLDEIGRGTATYDGLSIAWAVSEHLHEQVRCKTIFATHYHELTQLTDELSAARNYNAEVRERDGRILFTYRMRPGPANRSYGIEVATLAGLPADVLTRARRVLALLEGEELVAALNSTSALRPKEKGGLQMALFESPSPVIEALRGIDINALTPLQGLSLLAELVQRARND